MKHKLTFLLIAMASLLSSQWSNAQGPALPPEAAKAIEEAKAKVAAIEESGAGEEKDMLRPLFELTEAYSKASLVEDGLKTLTRALAIARNADGNEHTNVAHCLHSIGSIHFAQGHYREAEQFNREALAIKRKLMDPLDLQLAVSLDALAWSLYKQGGSAKIEEAESLFLEGLDIRKKVLGEKHSGVAEILGGLSQLYTDRGDLEKAEKFSREIMGIWKVVWGKQPHPTLAGSMNRLALIQMARGQYADAEKQLREAEAMLKSLGGEPDFGTAMLYTNLGEAISRQGRHADAEKYFREALALQDKLFGSGHPGRIKMLSNLGAALAGQDQLKEAEKVSREALAMGRELLGPDHETLATGLNNLAGLLSDDGRIEEASKMAEEAVAMARRLHKEAHGTVVTCLTMQSCIDVMRGKFAEADAASKEGLAMARQVYKPPHPDLVYAMNCRISALGARGVALLGKDNKEGERHLRDALALRKSSDNPDQGNIAALQGNLALALMLQDRLPEARKTYLGALAILEARPGDELEKATVLCNLGILELKAGNSPAAEVRIRQSLAIFKEFPDQSESQAWVAGEMVWAGLADALSNQNKDSEAVEALRMAIVTERQVRGEESPLLAGYMVKRASLLTHLGEYPAAENERREILKLMKKLHGEEHLEVALAATELALVLGLQAKLEEAEKTHREALAIRRKLLGNEHPEVAESLTRISVLLGQQNRLSDAEDVAREALAILRELPGEPGFYFGVGLTNLGSILGMQAEFTEAEASFREGLTVLKAQSQPNKQQVSQSLINLGGVLATQGKFEPSGEAYKEALDILAELKGKDAPETLNCLGTLAGIFEQQRKYEDAEKAWREVMEGMEKLLGPNHPNVSAALANMGNSLWWQGRFIDAEKALQRALEIEQASMGEQSPAIQYAMARVLRDLGKFAEADRLFLRTLPIAEAKYGPDHPNTAKGLVGYASSLEMQKKFKDAKPLAERALAIQEKALPPGPPDLEATYEVLGKIHTGLGNKEDGEKYEQLAEGIREQAAKHGKKEK